MLPIPLRKSKATLPNGETVDLYSIGFIADRLGLKSDAVRKWVRLGYIPESWFTAGGMNFRMYTQEQIDIICSSYKESGYHRGPGSSLKCTNFSRLCHERMAELKKKYMQKSENGGNK